MPKKFKLTFTERETWTLAIALDFAVKYEDGYLDAISDCDTPTDKIARREALENIRKFKNLSDKIRGQT